MPLEPDVLRETVLDYALRTFWALLVALITIVIARAVRSLTMRSLARQRTNANATVLIGNLAQVGVLVAGVLLILAIYTQGAFGWILTSFSVLGIVVGLSLQDILRNFFAGLWILVERPFRIGDTIEVMLHTGEVREVSFRTTQLRTADGREVIIPNGALMTHPVINLSRYPLRRATLSVGMPTDRAEELDAATLRQIVVGAGASTEPDVHVALVGVAGGRAVHEVTFWAKDPSPTVSAALVALRARFPHAEVRGAPDGSAPAARVAYFEMNARESIDAER